MEGQRCVSKRTTFEESGGNASRSGDTDMKAELRKSIPLACISFATLRLPLFDTNTAGHMLSTLSERSNYEFSAETIDPAYKL